MVKLWRVPIDLPDWSFPAQALGAYALFVAVDLARPLLPDGRAVRALLVASHIDADSSYRAELQLGRVSDLVRKTAKAETVDAIIVSRGFRVGGICPYAS